MKIVGKKILVALLSSVVLFGCGEENSAPDTKYIKEFHQKFFEKTQKHTLKENDLALYVDYSTCITLGQHSSFFQSLRGVFSNSTKHYYSIKGPNIQKEETVDVWNELSNIKEVNFADLKNAANLIADGNSEAVLLTDGEYYQENIAGGGINYPYMTDALKKWLKKGHDVYIFAEPYIEKNKGLEYNKKRLYFIFTDSRIKGNIYENICETVDLDKFPEVEMFHLSVDHPAIEMKGGKLELNPTLSASVKSYGDNEIQDWAIDWDAIRNVIMNGLDPNTGVPLPYGECVMGGLKVDKESYGGYKISDIEVNVYDINYDYFNFYSLKDGCIAVDEKPQLYPSPNSFVYDTAEFQKTGIVNIYLDVSMWNPEFLTGNTFNYTKIDICVSNCVNVFNKNNTMFNFDALGSPGEINTSVTESIKQCLFDPEIKEMLEKTVLYSIYIKSNKY